jgi:LysM repeat protein
MPSVSAADIDALIHNGHLVEAGALLTMHGEGLPEDERRRLEQTRERLWNEATALLARGETLEQAGNAEAAHTAYQQVAALAIDYPGIDNHLKQTADALALTRAVRHRSQRIRTAAGPKKHPVTRRLPLMIAGALIGGFGAGIWLFLGQPSVPDPKHLPAVPAVAQTQPPQDRTLAPPPRPEPTATALPKSDSPPLPTSVTRPSDSSLQAASPEPPVIQGQQPPLTALQSPDSMVTLPLPRQTTTTEAATPPVAEATDAGKQPESLVQPAPLAPEPAPAPSTEIPKIYTVQRGDSLALIAQRHFCTQNVWYHIYRQNSAILSSPHKLHPGLQLDLSGIESQCPPPR